MKKRLYRSRTDKMMGGVAGGLADYFDIDPVIMRVLFVVLVFGAGVSIVGYIILWIIVPENPVQTNNFNGEFQTDEERNSYQEQQNATNQIVVEEKKSSKKVLGGALLIIIGLVFLLENFIPEIDFENVWPVILVAVGSFIIYSSISKSKNQVSL